MAKSSSSLQKLYPPPSSAAPRLLLRGAAILCGVEKSGRGRGDFLEKVPSSPSKPPPISPKDFQLVGRLHERSSFHSSAVRKREKQAREPEQKMFRLPSFVYETRLGSYCPSVPYSLFIYRERGKQGFDEHESLWKGWGWRKVFPSLFPNLRPIFLQTSIPACRRPLRARPQ